MGMSGSSISDCSVVAAAVAEVVVSVTAELCVVVVVEVTVVTVVVCAAAVLGGLPVYAGDAAVYGELITMI